MRRYAAIILTWSLALAACGGTERDAASRDTSMAGGAPDSPPPTTPADQATASMRDPAGRDLGTLTLSADTAGINVGGRLTGLPPGTHGIHLHTAGRCEPPAFESAGDHWNPTNRQHGTKSPKGPHLGDLPNLEVGRDSSVTVQATTPGGTLRGGNQLLDADGAAVVVHAKADDYKGQPSGNSGDRIACGVVNGS